MVAALAVSPLSSKEAGTDLLGVLSTMAGTLQLPIIKQALIILIYWSVLNLNIVINFFC